jgi:hypothetical protein
VSAVLDPQSRVRCARIILKRAVKVGQNGAAG